jgi:hypothetical protein
MNKEKLKKMFVEEVNEEPNSFTTHETWGDKMVVITISSLS